MCNATVGEVRELSRSSSVGSLSNVQPKVSLDEGEGVRWKGPTEDREIERRAEKGSAHALHVPPGFQ